MYEIDDAGGGCFLGPEVLVIHQLETGQAWYLLIPPEVKDRVRFATKILKSAFLNLQIPKTETVKLCRGEIFDQFQLFLQEQEYQVVREKVSSNTDCLAESKFMEILYSYGFPTDLELRNRNYQEFYEWVSFWYYCQPRKLAQKIRKIRLRPPLRPKIIVQKYPNLIRQMFEDQAVV